MAKETAGRGNNNSDESYRFARGLFRTAFAAVNVAGALRKGTIIILNAERAGRDYPSLSLSPTTRNCFCEIIGGSRPVENARSTTFLRSARDQFHLLRTTPE